MEISLSPELMEIIGRLADTLSKVQGQYLITLVPTIGMFLLYFLIMFHPNFEGLRLWWHTRRFIKETGHSVIRLIHVSPTSLFDMFKMPMITLDDSQKILVALKESPTGRPISLILHTPGGMVIAAEQIARAIKACGREVHAYIPQYAMSGGTLVALACSKIHMGNNALLGPLDPQLMVGLFDQYPCASLIKALKVPNPNRDDRTLIYADVSEKAISQMKIAVAEILTDRMGETKAQEIASRLCDGNWTHDYGINLQRAQELGLPVDDAMPERMNKISQCLPCTSSVAFKKHKKDENDGRLHIVL